MDLGFLEGGANSRYQFPGTGGSGGMPPENFFKNGC